MRQKDIERFKKWYKQGKKNECWIWTGWKNAKSTHTQFYLKGEQVGVHRVAYEIANGKFNKKLFVCHSCDNGRCVNPNHLWLGTAADNMKDCTLKQRFRHYKLNEDQVREIRSEKSNGFLNRELAKKYGCSKATISGVKRWLTWRYIKS